MNYKIAICDDEISAIQYVSSVVTDWAARMGHQLQLQSFSSAEAFLFHYEDENDYDILLLDIEMDNMDGITLAKSIREKNETIQIVFITGYSDYISEGYEVSALHYLMKPVRPEKLCEVLCRAAEKLRKNDLSLVLETAGGMVRIPLYEIRYLEVNQNYVTVHAKDDFTVKKTLKELEEKLDERFFRTGRSYILNLNYIERITKKDVFLSTGAVIPLPRGMYEPLNRAVISNT